MLRAIFQIKPLLRLCLCWFAMMASQQTNADADPEPHLIYLHGAIAEGGNATPVHRAWGEYNLPKIIQTLQTLGTAYAPQRPSAKPFSEHTEQTIKLIKEIKESGAAEEDIWVIGFSKGGQIALNAVAALAPSKINLVVLGGCFGGESKKPTLARLSQVYSIHELSDSVAKPCVFGENTTLVEEKIATKLSHGAFYQPRDEWLSPLKKWLE